jgi:hypothetical protein
MHEHPTPKPCKHELKFCEHCDTVYCEKCKTEWKKEASFADQLQGLGKAKPWMPTRPDSWGTGPYDRAKTFDIHWTCGDKREV